MGQGGDFDWEKKEEDKKVIVEVPEKPTEVVVIQEDKIQAIRDILYNVVSDVELELPVSCESVAKEIAALFGEDGE